MWVIFCKDTGTELDRIENTADAVNMVREYSDTNVFGYTAGKRWEA